jgi:flagellar biosynthesis component FlhA
MAATSIIGHMLQLEFARSVTLFPTIILAWTVERLSILWDEDGPKEVAIQTGGSLITAIGCYFVMGSTVLQYLIFTFPEFLLIVLAVILMLGQYTGYRLSELQRFGPMAKEEDA